MAQRPLPDGIVELVDDPAGVHLAVVDTDDEQGQPEQEVGGAPARPAGGRS